MKPITILQHEADSGPGSILEALNALGVEHELRRLDLGDRVPVWPDETAGIISLGGYMDAKQTREFPFLETELHLMRRIVREGGPVWGICLGAQLLALASGGDVYQRRKPELGWVSIEKIVDDPLLHGISSPFVAFCWHANACRIATTSHLVAERDGEAHVFRAGGRAWGTQFHPEVDAEMAPHWVEEAVKRYRDLEPALVNQLREQTDELLPGYPAFCHKLTANFVAVSGLLPPE
jgi:GMP synthase-like glutamine amidotransferase